jgi:carnitine-CoA ligase
MFVVPVIPEIREFEARFNVETATYYGSTEASNVLTAPFGTTLPSGCGWPRKGVEVRLVNDRDEPIGADEIGELVLRTDQPWELMLEYLDQPAKTLEIFRNGWLHTGDLMRVMPDGQFAFVDRAKDSLRRRGENVSSFEVEREVLTHPAVQECAIVAVPSEHTEDEILLVAVVDRNHLDEELLWRYLADRLPYFMVPRFIAFRDELPRTATEKVAKAEIRRAGVESDTWDSDAAGFKVTRHGISGVDTQRP